MDKLFFRHTVKLEAGWTLRRALGGNRLARMDPLESPHGDLKTATEAAARNNIAQALAKKFLPGPLERTGPAYPLILFHFGTDHDGIPF